MEVKSNLSEIYPYLQWLEPFIAEWRTKSNFETESIDISDSNDEGSDTARSITPDIEAVSDTSQPPVKPTSTKVTKTKQPSWKFHKKSSNESKKTQNVAEKTEMTLIQSLGASTVKDYKSQEKEKDDDEIFGNLITSQLKQCPQTKEFWWKCKFPIWCMKKRWIQSVEVHHIKCALQITEQNNHGNLIHNLTRVDWILYLYLFGILLL